MSVVPATPPKVPLNYFGRGEDFNLPDDPVFLRKFEDQYREWEQAHPDDPDGQKALDEWKKGAKATPKPKLNPELFQEATEETSLSEPDYSVLERLVLKLPLREYTIFKNFCFLKHRRPRDILAIWIKNYAKITSAELAEYRENQST